MSEYAKKFELATLILISTVIIFVLSIGYLKFAIGEDSLLQQRAFSLGNTSISVTYAALGLCAFWFYLFAKIFIARHRSRLDQLLTKLAELHDRLNDLLKDGLMKDLLLTFKKLLLDNIIHKADGVISSLPPGLVIEKRYRYHSVSHSQLVSSLLQDIAWITWEAKQIFGIAGILAGLSLLFLYKSASSVPITLLSFKSLIFLIGSYLCGNIIGYYMAQNIHKYFSSQAPDI